MAADHRSARTRPSTTCASVLRDTPLLRWILNSLVFATLSTVSIVATSAITGYILGKFRFPGVSVLFAVILATAIVPFEVYMIPLYLNVQKTRTPELAPAASSSAIS